ncbi:MAG: AAA domain-containing protein, partial [Halococcoides sp.]
TIRPDRGRGEPVGVRLLGKWTETAAILDPGMEIALYDLEDDDPLLADRSSTVVVEPDVVVDVTDIREWVQCPRQYYLDKLTGTPLAYPIVKGTIVHEVFGDLLRGIDAEAAVERRVHEAGLELGLLDRSASAVREDVSDHARAIEGWLAQGSLPDGGQQVAPDRSEWRSEITLIDERLSIKGRADAVRRGAPVELKTGKNTRREPRFEDKIQAAAYALLLADGDREAAPDTGTLLYTKNAAVERTEIGGDLSPAKDFSIGDGLLRFVIRARNEIAAMEAQRAIPTGEEADATCEYCFEQDTCMALAGRLDQHAKAGAVGTALPATEREYVEEFYTAIEAERRAIHSSFTDLWEQSAADRAEADRALVDLEPLGRRQRDDGRWELRARSTGSISKIREGDIVLASDGDPVGGNAELARVERLGDPAEPGDDRTDDPPADVIVTTDEPLDLCRMDIYPSDIGVDRMLTAIHDAVLARRPPERKDVLFERRDPEFEAVEATFVPNNDAQDRAVRRAVAAEDCALIHGPPGTGKTYTLARLVDALVERGDRVLVSAFTNRAVDTAVEAIRERGVSVVRMGTESGVSPSVADCRLDPAGDPDERATTLREADVVAATTATCGSRVMREQSVDVAVIDEAGQLTEPGALAAIALADRFVLVGDHHQLPPVVQSDPEAGATLSRSLFERLIETYPEAGVMLTRQYRMAQRIQAFPSREFYDGALRPADGETAAQKIADLPAVDAAAVPAHLRRRVAFIDPDGADRGAVNPIEADTVAEIVAAYRAAGVSDDAIGVIAPYRAQVAAIERRVPDTITVDTVDRFQGSSREVIVLSFVGTGSLDGPIFEDYRRVNVALTRAKKALVLVGDRDALGSDPVYARLVEWADATASAEDERAVIDLAVGARSE